MLTLVEVVGVFLDTLMGIEFSLQHLAEYLCIVTERCLVQTEKGRMNSQTAKSKYPQCQKCINFCG